MRSSYDVHVERKKDFEHDTFCHTEETFLVLPYHVTIQSAFQQRHDNSTERQNDTDLGQY